MKYFFIVFYTVLSGTCAVAQNNDKRTPESTEVWEPQPRIVTPGKNVFDAPSDAVVLFDGKNTSKFTHLDGSIVKWDIKDGALVVKGGTGDIKTSQAFGDVQLHIEFRTPEKVESSGQGRGNSGVFFCEMYEVQILDNYENKTYANGQAASIYKQYPPLVNACKKPGEWQTYDIIFTMPKFNADGIAIEPAKITVFHNGVLVQNAVPLLGRTEYIGSPTYKPHGKGSIKLQDHGNPTAFRNIWVREL